MWKAITFIGHSGAAVIAMSPIDTALWDVAGKAANLPLNRLLGAFRDKVEAYASEGLWLHQSIDELQKEAQGFVARGFNGMKMRVGKQSLEDDVERVAKVREAIGPGVKLMVDANQAWDVPTAVRFARAVEEHDLFWIEEPVDYQDYRGMAAIAARIDTPLCVGETNYTTEDFRRLCEMDCGYYIMPDLMRMGGVGEWMKVARLCEAFHRPVTPHLFMEVSSHQACASSNAVWQEHQPWWEPIWREPVDFREGFIHIRQKPGLGLEWDERAIERYEVK
jgi:L-alanine-DL-glutamate epimerase-like enolase superfamily enzyme